MELFHAQLESLRAQTDERWLCVISDDASEPSRFEEIARAVAGDERFVLSRSPERLGAYRNFERALGLVPPDAELVALCDQDDRWHPDKLATLRAALGDAQLVYSDQRARRAGRTRAARVALDRAPQRAHEPRLAPRGEHDHRAPRPCSGARSPSSRCRSPRRPGWQFHDHWLALVALASGRRRLRRPAALRLRPARGGGGRARPPARPPRPPARAARAAGGPPTSTAISRAGSRPRRCSCAARTGSAARSGAR